MYKFSIAVTKTYYKLHCLGRPKFIILCSYRSELGYSQGVSRVAVLSKGSGRESTSVPFPASEATHIPLLTAPFLYLQSQQCCILLTALPLSHLPLTTAGNSSLLVRICMIRLGTSR